jgi:hypothetical protein
MTWILVLVTVTHVLSGVFWAGTTAVLARTGAANIETLAFPQIGSAILAVLLGVTLGALNSHGGGGTGDHILAAGAACALAALLVQILSLRQVRVLAAAPEAAKPPLRRRLAVRQRIAAGLLGLTIAAMVSWRFF